MIGIGSSVGNYEVLAKVGSGAMGSVFLAEHPSIGKRVALKVIHSDLGANAEMVSRFFTEARALTQINNDHVVDVQDFGQTPDGDNFIVMEYLDGRSLSNLLKSDRVLPEALACHLAAQIADGLAAAHSRGIVHRDLKPDNIYLIHRNNDPAFVKILDFGLAKLTQGGGVLSHQTQAGSVLGTPHYMAPEQCEGRPDIDHRVDIYALGCILYEMLCGQVPFPGEGFGEVLVKHLRENPPLPSRHNPRITKGVEKIILHALAKQKEFRFRDMLEFRGALQNPERYSRALEGEAPLPSSTMELLAQQPQLQGQATAILEAPADLPAPAGGLPSDTMQMDAPPLAALEAVAVPAPSDYLEEDEVPRGRRGLVIGLAAAGALALCGAGFVVWRAVSPKPMQAVAVTSDPIGATVLVDGATVGTTPWVMKIPAGGSAELVLRKQGFADAKQRVAAGAEAVVVKLWPAAPAKPAAPPPPDEPAPVEKPKAEKRSSVQGKADPAKVREKDPEEKPKTRPVKIKRRSEDSDDVLEPSF